MMNRKFDNQPSGIVVMDRVCPFCGKVSTVTADADGYALWRGGWLIQNALPELTANERELLMTGICSACWDDTFNEPDTYDCSNCGATVPGGEACWCQNELE